MELHALVNVLGIPQGESLTLLLEGVNGKNGRERGQGDRWSKQPRAFLFSRIHFVCIAYRLSVRGLFQN